MPKTSKKNLEARRKEGKAVNIIKKLREDLSNNLDYMIACVVCSSEFNEYKNIPKILDCGHSFCLSCLKKVYETNRMCPKCRKDLRLRLGEYNTNYSLLESSKLLKSFRNDFFLPAETEKLIDQKTKLAKKIYNIYSSLTSVEYKLDALHYVINSENFDLNEGKRVNIKIKDISRPNFEYLRESVNINLNICENFDKCLNKIYNRLKNDEKIYAVTKEEKVVKYGKISIENNLILFHSFSETEQPAQSSLIWFDDFKSSITGNNFLTFLKLSCNERKIVQLITMKMFDTSNSIQFIRLCTGEYGQSYKGCHYKQFANTTKRDVFKGILKLIIPQNTNFDDKSLNDYNLRIVNDTNSLMGDDVILLDDKGNFLICNTAKNTTFKHAVGKVKSPRNVADFISFSDPSKLKVLDCGIVFEL